MLRYGESLVRVPPELICRLGKLRLAPASRACVVYGRGRDKGSRSREIFPVRRQYCLSPSSSCIDKSNRKRNTDHSSCTARTRALLPQTDIVRFQRTEDFAYRDGRSRRPVPRPLGQAPSYPIPTAKVLGNHGI